MNPDRQTYEALHAVCCARFSRGRADADLRIRGRGA